MKYLNRFLILLLPFIFVACGDDDNGGGVVTEPTLKLGESKTSMEVTVSDLQDLDFIYEMYADFQNVSNSAQTYEITMKFNEIDGDFGAGFCTTTFCYPGMQQDFTPDDDTFTLEPGQFANEVFLPGLVSFENHGFSLDIYPDFDGDQIRTAGSLSITMEFKNVNDPDDVLSVDFEFTVVLDETTLKLGESKTSMDVTVADLEELDFIYEMYADFQNVSDVAQTYEITMKFNEIVGDFGAGFCTTKFCYPATQTDFTPEDDTFTLEPGQFANEVFLPGLVSFEEHGFSLDLYPDFDGDQERTEGSVSITMEFRNVNDPDDVLSVDFDFSVSLN